AFNPAVGNESSCDIGKRLLPFQGSKPVGKQLGSIGMRCALRNQHWSSFCQNRIGPYPFDRCSFLLVLENANEIQPQINLECPGPEHFKPCGLPGPKDEVVFSECLEVVQSLLFSPGSPQHEYPLSSIPVPRYGAFPFRIEQVIPFFRSVSGRN